MKVRGLHAEKKINEERDINRGTCVVIYCGDCAFLALETLSTASRIGLRPFKTVICALKYGAGNSMCISSEAVNPPPSPSVGGKELVNPCVWPDRWEGPPGDFGEH